MNFAEHLMALRRQRGWSQEELGGRVGVTRQTVSKWEVGQSTPELEKLAGDLPIRGVIVDPSAASFLETIRRHGRFHDIKASNAVLDGIRDVATQLQTGRLFICEGCADCIREFGLYRWDERYQGQDQVCKENDHAMDEIRYFAATVAGKEGRGGVFAGCVERGVF